MTKRNVLLAFHHLALAALLLGIGACSMEQGVAPATNPTVTPGAAEGKGGVRLMDLTPIDDEVKVAEFISPPEESRAPLPDPDRRVHVCSPSSNASENVTLWHRHAQAYYSEYHGSDGRDWVHISGGAEASIYRTI